MTAIIKRMLGMEKTYVLQEDEVLETRIVRDKFRTPRHATAVSNFTTR